MHGLHSVTPPTNPVPEDVLDRRTTGSLTSRLEKLQQPWSEVVKDQSTSFILDEEKSALNKAGMILKEK